MELAALFVFINKHCFNGLYRVMVKDFSMFHTTIVVELLLMKMPSWRSQNTFKE